MAKRRAGLVLPSQDTYNLGVDQSRGPARGNRRFEMVGMNALHQFCIDGRVWGVNLGTETTPISFAKTALDDEQPQLEIDVPVGTTIVPLYLNVVYEDAVGAINEIVVGCADTLVGAGTSTPMTPKNLRTDQPTTCRCTVRSLYSAAGTDVTDAADYYYEFFRFTDAFKDVVTKAGVQDITWSAAKSAFVPVIKGDGSLVCFIAGGTAPAGYLTVVWAEFYTEEVMS